MSEAEVAPDFVIHKAEGKRKFSRAALHKEKNAGQELENGVKYNQETIDGQRTNNNIQSWNGNRTEASDDGLYGARPSRDNAGIQPFLRRSEVRSSNNGIIIHDPSPEFKAELEAKGKPINSYKELAANSDEDAASFISKFRAANEFNGKKAAQVYEYLPEEYKQMKLFTAENGKSGFALKPDGDIVSVFSAEKGSTTGLMNLAIQNGGKKLDCFDTFLPKIYKKFGFVEVDRVKWNEEYKPTNWDKEFFKQYNNGEPDVVYMELKSSNTPTQEKQITKKYNPDRETYQEKLAREQSEQVRADVTHSEYVAKTTGRTSEDIIRGINSGDVVLKTVADIDSLVSQVADETADIRDLFNEKTFCIKLKVFDLHIPLTKQYSFYGKLILNINFLT